MRQSTLHKFWIKMLKGLTIPKDLQNKCSIWILKLEDEDVQVE